MASSSSSARTLPGAGEWYADGLRFQCTQCGNCCTGPTGYVWFTPEEGSAMAARLGIDEPTFYENYARKIDGQWSLNENHNEHGYDCVFLDRTSVPGKAVCSMYEARPTQCRAWPFWPENLKSPGAWSATKKRTPCPGMDSGKLVPIVQIRVQREASRR